MAIPLFLRTLMALAAAAAPTVHVALPPEAGADLVCPGTYAAVTVRVENTGASAVAEVRLRGVGPVETAAAWRVAPGETGERTLPVFVVSGEAGLGWSLHDAAGRSLGQGTVPLPVRMVPAETAVVALGPGDPDLDAVAERSLRTALGGAVLAVRLDPEALVSALRRGVVDAVMDAGAAPILGRVARVRRGPDGSLDVRPVPFPADVMEPVQPETHRLLASPPWPAEDRRRLALALVLYGLAVLAAGAVVPRRRPGVAAIVLAALAGGATAALWLWGDLARTSADEARVFYVRPGVGVAALERFVYLESRGGASVRHILPRTSAEPWPRPVLGRPDDLFRPQWVLRLDTEASVEALGPQVVLQILDAADPPFGAGSPEPSAEALAALADRPDVVAALCVEGDRATDPAGRTQRLDAWSAEWKTSPDAERAWAGRSLAWWARARQEGDGPFLAAWYREAGPAGEGVGPPPRRRPALVVYGGGPANGFSPN